MPCTDYADSDDFKRRQSDARVCALLSELSNMMNKSEFNEFVKKAETNGKIDIHSFWNEHKQQDNSRLLEIISNLSVHERKQLKNLL